MSHHSKFPHDRVVYFSDAVFAIAITLLVIEIKVPTHDQIHEFGLGGALYKLLPLFIGYFVSFLVTALFWKAHMQLATHIKTFDTKLVWLNIWLLLFVALMPFSTALYSENFGYNEAFAFYHFNLAGISLMSFWMQAYTIRKEDLENAIGKEQVRWLKIRSLLVPIIFLLCIPIALLTPMVGRFAFVLIFVIQLAGDRYHKKKALVQS
jgi:uncharacterized membrane protein